MKVKMMLMVMLVMIAATCISSAATVLVDESFDSVADVSYTLGTTDTVTGTDAGNWIYDLRSAAGEGGFSGGKVSRSLLATDTGEVARYVLSHGLSSSVSVSSITNIFVTADIAPASDATQNFAVGLQSGIDDIATTRCQLQINMKNNKELIILAVGGTPAGIGPITGKPAHIYRLGCLFTPKGDGTTDCDYTLTDLTDGTQDLDGTTNMAAEPLGTDSFDTVQIFFNGKSTGTVDNVKVVINVGTAVDDWVLF